MINTMNMSYAIFFSELCIENTRVDFYHIRAGNYIKTKKMILMK